MAHWLLKSEPSAYSWSQLVKDKHTSWTGVRNPQAQLNLKAMKAGDRCFFYHSGEGKEIVGIVEIIKPYYPDPSDLTGKFGMVDVRAVGALKKPVSLDAVKADPRLAKMALVTNARLSVQPVTPEEWNYILKLGGS